MRDVGKYRPNASATFHNKQKSDAPADGLLLSLIKRMKERHKSFEALREFEDLDRQRNFSNTGKVRRVRRGEPFLFTKILKTIRFGVRARIFRNPTR
jgi:hypothetical protein